MDQLLNHARGPLFRLTFALMVLGLLRLFALSVWNVAVCYYRAGNKKQNYRLIFKQTIRYLLPWAYFRKPRPVYGPLAFVFHIGLLIVPIFLFGHIQLWRQSTGLHWPALPQVVADVLTIITIVAAILLLIGRLAVAESRFTSRKQDVLWPLVLAFVFATGFLCAHPAIAPLSYKATMLLHVLSAELVFLLIPFTKIAHCVLIPFSHMLSDLGWRFPATSGRDVLMTLGKEGKPI